MLAISMSARATLVVDVLKAPSEKKHEIGEVDLATSTGAHSVIDGESIQGRYADLSSVIEHEIGVQVRSFGGFGSFSTAVLRGASSEQVIVYLDGIPLNDTSTGVFNLSDIAIENIERIEVYRGVTPIELGGSSIGGAINIITRKASELSAGNMKLTAGSYSTYKVSGGYSGQHDRDGFIATAEYFTSDNDYEMRFDNGTEFNLQDDFDVAVNNDQVDHVSSMLKWSRKVTEDIEFDTRLSYYEKSKGIPSKNNSPEASTEFDTKTSSLLTQLKVEGVNGSNFDLNLKLDLSRGVEVFDDDQSQLGSLQRKLEYKTDRNGVQAFTVRNGGSHELRFLGGLSREDYKFSDLLTNIAESKNSRIEKELGLELKSFLYERSFMFSLSYRYQEIEDELDYAVTSFNDVVSQADKTYRVSDPQLGVRFEVDSAWVVFANIGQYTRIPTFFELFGDKGLFVGNEELKQEVSVNSDIGIQYTHYKPSSWLNDASIYVGLFHNDSEDLIIRNYNSLGIGVSENLSNAVINGIEFQLKLYPSYQWQVNFNMTLLDSKTESGISNFDDNSLPGQYGQVYSLYAGYKKRGWRIGLQQDYRKDMYFERGNDHKGQDIYTADLSVMKSWSGNSLELQILNITDERYVQFNSRPLPGISYLLTYQYNF